MTKNFKCIRTQKKQRFRIISVKKKKILYLTLLTTKLSHFHINGYIKY